MASPPRAAQREQARIFVSYSHFDRSWLSKLQIVLAPLLRGREDLLLWDDSRIRPGEQWRAELAHELRAASVAVLLVSQRFLASRFIAEDELPPLLQRAEREGIRILWIPIGACLYEESPLAGFQAAWDPSRPLNTLKRPQQESALVHIAQTIGDAATLPVPARSDLATATSGLLGAAADGSVPLASDWYALPWAELLAGAERVECAVSHMDAWVDDAAAALDDLFARDGSLRLFLPMPGSPAARRVAERLPDFEEAAVESKIRTTRTKLRALQRGRGQLDVRWTRVFNMHRLMLLDDSVLLVSPYAHFRSGSRTQNPTFAVPLSRFPAVASWARRELAGFRAASSTRITTGPAKRRI
jgi:TIR domain